MFLFFVALLRALRAREDDDDDDNDKDDADDKDEDIDEVDLSAGLLEERGRRCCKSRRATAIEREKLGIFGFARADAPRNLWSPTATPPENIMVD